MCDVILTSKSRMHATGLRIVGHRLVFSSIPIILRDKCLLLFLTEIESKAEFNKKVFPPTSLSEYSIDTIDDGVYSLNLFFKKEGDELFWGYMHGNDIVIRISSGAIHFIESPYLKDNVARLVSLFRRISNNDIFTDSRSYTFLDPRIIAIARDITDKSILPYSKALAIHDWVASHIYYDEDSYLSGEYMFSDASALTTLNTRKGVCQGYTNLTIALLRALGIPAIQVECIADLSYWLPIESINEEHKRECNHVIVSAFLNSKWVFMDVTWDSDNYYRKGELCHRTGMGLSHKYFDVDLGFLSKTHFFI